jgi:phage terminase large subunit
MKVSLKNVPKRTNKVYRPYYLNDSRFLLLIGGAGSGKSVFASQKVLYRTIAQLKHRYIVLRKVASTLKDSVFNRIQGEIYSWGLEDLFHITKNPMEIIYKPNGNEILFKGLDIPEKIKSIEKPTSVWCEELTEFTELDIIQLNLRLRGNLPNYKQIMGSFNPISVTHWIKRFFFDNIREDTSVLKTTYRDNAWLNKEDARVLEDLVNQDPNLHRIYALGEWGVLKGLIYNNWDIVDDLPESYDKATIGIDFGFNNPTAVILCLEKDQEVYEKELLYRSGMTNTDLISFLKEIKKDGIINENMKIVADCAEPDRIEEIERAGFWIEKSKKGPGSVKKRIDVVKSKKTHITKDSVNLKKEKQSYSWKEDKDGNTKDEPVKFMDHLMDAEGYAIGNSLDDEPRITVF